MFVSHVGKVGHAQHMFRDRRRIDRRIGGCALPNIQNSRFTSTCVAMSVVVSPEAREYIRAGRKVQDHFAVRTNFGSSNSNRGNWCRGRGVERGKKRWHVCAGTVCQAKKHDEMVI